MAESGEEVAEHFLCGHDLHTLEGTTGHGAETGTQLGSGNGDEGAEMGTQLESILPRQERSSQRGTHGTRKLIRILFSVYFGGFRG